MDRELIYLIVCFIVGIFLFYLLRSSCGCQVVEGAVADAARLDQAAEVAKTECQQLLTYCTSPEYDKCKSAESVLEDPTCTDDDTWYSPLDAVQLRVTRDLDQSLLIKLPNNQYIKPTNCKQLRGYDWEKKKDRGALTLYDLGLVWGGVDCDDSEEAGVCKATLGDICLGTFKEGGRGAQVRVLDKCCNTCKGQTPT